MDRWPELLFLNYSAHWFRNGRFGSIRSSFQALMRSEEPGAPEALEAAPRRTFMKNISFLAVTSEGQSSAKIPEQGWTT